VTPTRADLLQVLSRHVGAWRGVHMRDLARALDPNAGLATERRARDLIAALRAEGHHICGHPATGYYMASNPDELDGTCRFLYDRAMSSLRQVAAMKRVSLPDLEGQLRLRT
jgi:hypothetical protein